MSKSVGKYIPLDTVATTIILCVLGVIVIVAVWATLVVYRKAQRTNDDILNQLEDYEQES